MDRYRGSSRRSPPPRDRPPLRDRDNHPDVEYFGQGESYRPGGVGDGPYRPSRERPSDSWNGDRRDDRRRDERREDIDSYIPPTSTRATRPRSRSPPPFRRRSRSPYGRREELFPDRTRSPPPRRYSPRRDERPRSPVRRRSRSPAYARQISPDGKRSRDFSNDGRRSPKRERLMSPHGRVDRPRSPPRRPYSPPRENNYRPRSRTPPRGGRSAYTDDNWRRRSPSPRPSGLNSNNTSRRSSPPLHSERAIPVGPATRSPAYAPRSYESNEQLSYRTRSPRRDFVDKSRDHSPPTVDREPPLAPPTGPASLRNGAYERAPPTGPSRGYNPPTQASPPTGPANQVSMSAHNRGTGPVLAAPTRPRGGGGGGRFDGPPRDFASPPIRGRGSLTYRAPGLRTPSFNEASPPSGPRASSFNAPARGDFGSPRGDFSGRGDFGGRGDFSGRGGYSSGFSRGDHSSYPATFRGSTNSSSTTYPRSQRFTATTPTNTTQTHLATLEKIVPGGKKLPSGLPVEQERRMKMLEMEAEKIREAINQKQKAKRESLAEWEIRERESEREALKSELAEGALGKLLEGEDGSSGAAF